MEIEDSNQNIIQVREKELSYFESFTKKNGIVWTNEDKNNLVLPLSKAYVGYIVTPERKINLKPKYKEIDFEHILEFIYMFMHIKQQIVLLFWIFLNLIMILILENYF